MARFTAVAVGAPPAGAGRAAMDVAARRFHSDTSFAWPAAGQAKPSTARTSITTPQAALDLLVRGSGRVAQAWATSGSRRRRCANDDMLYRLSGGRDAGAAASVSPPDGGVNAAARLSPQRVSRDRGPRRA